MVKDLKKDVDREIKAFLSDIKKNYRLHEISKLLFNGIKDFLERKGKRIRPILYLLTYHGYTKRKKFSYKRLIRSSLSLELLHDFLLVHDDVIDRSQLRRGKPTLHRLFNARLAVSPDNIMGSGLSIVAGDVIFALAVETLLDIDEEQSRKEKALRKFIEAAALTGGGEFIDIVNGAKGIDKIRRRDVFLNYTMKTAKYTFEAPMLMGAILAGAEKRELEKLSELGIVLGHAFQILDDLLDMFSTSKEIGKPVLSDLAESKKTLLVWKAYGDLSGKDKLIFKRIFKKENKAQADLNKLKKLVETSGAPAHCLKKTRSLLAEADHIIEGLRMKKEFKKRLRRLTAGFTPKIERLERAIKK